MIRVPILNSSSFFFELVVSNRHTYVLKQIYKAYKCQLILYALELYRWNCEETYVKKERNRKKEKEKSERLIRHLKYMYDKYYNLTL